MLDEDMYFSRSGIIKTLGGYCVLAVLQGIAHPLPLDIDLWLILSFWSASAAIPLLAFAGTFSTDDPFASPLYIWPTAFVGALGIALAITSFGLLLWSISEITGRIFLGSVGVVLLIIALYFYFSFCAWLSENVPQINIGKWIKQRVAAIGDWAIWVFDSVVIRIANLQS